MRPDYSCRSEEFDRYRTFSPEVMEKYMSNIIDLANLHGGERVLDGGAGTGRFSIPLSANHKVTALDCSREMMTKGTAKRGKLSWVQGDISRTPFRSGHFDLVLLAYVMHQVPDLNPVIEEAFRLSPKCIMITTDMRNRLPTLLDQAFPEVIKVDRERFPLIEDLEGACLLVGYERVRARRILFEQRLTKQRYLEMVQHKYLSTFDLISSAEFESGVSRLEATLTSIPGEDLVNRIQATFVSASRK